jgi:serine/threonine protein kinase
MLSSPMDNCAALKILFGVAEALRHLNDIGISHGSICPNNVLLGPNREPLICDFGLAALRGEPGTSDLANYATIVLSVLTGRHFDVLPEQLPESVPGPFADVIRRCHAADYRFDGVVHRFLDGELTLPLTPADACDVRDYSVRTISPTFTSRSLISALSELHLISDRNKQLMDGFHRLHDDVEGLLRSARKGNTKKRLPPLPPAALRSCPLGNDAWGGIFGQFPGNAADVGLVKITGNSRDPATDAALPKIIDYRSDTFWMFRDEEASFVQFEFSGCTIILTHYWFRTNPSPSGFAHLRNWTTRAVDAPGE